MTQTEKTGQVILVGAGCGKGLCTLAGLKAIREAQSLVYDDLIDPELLAQCPEDAQLIYVGKRSGKHSMTQEEINKVLVAEAQKGRRVVRLKGGDSFVFGRGGEEILALQEAGIPYDIIPGVTSSVAVPEHLGLPVTHRGVARSFTVITGHTKDDSSENWEALAKLDGTLVFLMGVEKLSQICSKLMEYGKPIDTPASILFRGYGIDEGRIDGTLADLPAKTEGKLLTPGIIVVGKTAALHFERTLRRPLEGCHVTVCGSERFTDICCKELEGAGAQTDAAESIRIMPTPEAIPDADVLKTYDWLVFTSRNGIEIFFEELRRRKLDMRVLGGMKVACIGSSTADELADHGIYADFVPTDYTAVALGRELPEVLERGAKVLILRAQNGSAMLRTELDKAGVCYEDRAIYHTAASIEGADDKGFQGSGDLSEERTEGALSYIVFASASGVDAYLKDHNLPEGTKPVCIGEYTAQKLEEHGYTDYLTAYPHTAQGIRECIERDACKR
jgi:uroporphyrinogen III methyltransferase / synthase